MPEQESHFANPDSISWQRVASAYRKEALQALILRHVAETSSRFATMLPHDWPVTLRKFWQVVPKGYQK